MKSVTLQHLNHIITMWGNGTALSVTRKSDNQDCFMQGEEAGMALDEYHELMKDHVTPGTRASRFTESELIEQIFAISD
jgi:hypothetical protein